MSPTPAEKSASRDKTLASPLQPLNFHSITTESLAKKPSQNNRQSHRPWRTPTKAPRESQLLLRPLSPLTLAGPQKRVLIAFRRALFPIPHETTTKTKNCDLKASKRTHSPRPLHAWPPPTTANIQARYRRQGLEIDYSVSYQRPGTLDFAIARRHSVLHFSDDKSQQKKVE